MINYKKRIIDTNLEKYLNFIGAVLIYGPQGCGKTTTALKHAKGTVDLKYNLSHYSGEKPGLIDEWQRAPAVWDSVKNSVDESEDYGLYILTTSRTVNNNSILHSGTEGFTE